MHGLPEGYVFGTSQFPPYLAPKLSLILSFNHYSHAHDLLTDSFCLVISAAELSLQLVYKNMLCSLFIKTWWWGQVPHRSSIQMESWIDRHVCVHTWFRKLLNAYDRHTVSGRSDWFKYKDVVRFHAHLDIQEESVMLSRADSVIHS